MLGLEPDSPGDAADASRLTTELRAQVLARFRGGAERELAAMLDLASCPAREESPACMASIGADLGADFLIYGHVANGTVSLHLLDVAAHFVRRVATLPVSPTAAHDGFAKLTN